jgi:FAD/FMN-containing dehydrogenase
MNGLVESLREVVGDAHVLTGADDTAPYLTDWRGRYVGSALAVVRPATTTEVAEVVRVCTANGVAVVPQGGNTGLCGGATPSGACAAGEVLVSLARMSRIRAVDTANATVTVEAGCTLQQVQEAAEAVDRLFPLSLAAEGTATIGGNLSTNAGGVQVLRYGNARDLCLGLEVVLPDGRVWSGLRGLRKDNTGYDLKQLFIGAEGTLGLITAAVLKLYPRPRQVVTAWLAVASPSAAVELLSRLRAAVGDRVTAFELVGRQGLDLVRKHIPDSREPLAARPEWQVLVELSDAIAGNGLGAMLEQFLSQMADGGLIADAAIAQSEAQAQSMWRLRENISEAQKIEGLSIKHDVSLPVSRIAEFVVRADAALAQAFPGVRIVCFGHLGDGNLHYNPSQPEKGDNAAFIAATDRVNRIVYDIVNELGGSISAEHGLGQLKREEIRHYKSDVEMELMQAVKQAIDPRGLMNPGKVV